MTENQNFKKEVEEIKKKIKLLLLIYDHIRMKNQNIDTFKTSSIIYSKQMLLPSMNIKAKFIISLPI